GMTIALTKDELKKYKEAWENLNSVGTTYKDTLAGVDEKTKETILYYAKMGAKVDELKNAFPGLTKVQAEAAIESVKAAKEIEKVQLETSGIISKSHGDNINDWIKGERAKLAVTLESLKLQGLLTNEMLDAQMAKFDATVNAEIMKRNEGNAKAREYYVKQRDDAKNAYDLMQADSENHTAQEIREARQLYEEKERMLNHWAAAAHDVMDQEGKHAHEVLGQQVHDVQALTAAFRELNQTMAGGSADVTSQNFEQQLKNLSTNGGWNPAGFGSNIDFNQAFTWARMGYSFGEITGMFANMKSGISGSLPPPKGPRIPGFKEGGFGDFGEGTLAVLHGKEFITPADQMHQVGTVIFNVNGTAVQVAQQIKDIWMREIMQRTQLGAH
ncbi:MAG: hypothetical protein M3Y64_03060, partial [Gemmatimonadota bacterium]|nr:hypothetical protein [Gemmatimonadota bacterium]